MYFNELIKEWRIRSGITQKELAEELFMSPQAISLIERGERQASFDVFKKAANIFGKEIIFDIKDKDIFDELNEALIQNEMLQINALMSVDREDIYKVMEKGKTYFSKASGQTIDHIMKRVCRPFRGELAIENAKSIILMVEGGEDFTFDHLDEAADYIYQRSHSNTQVTVGAVVDDEIKTGFTVRLVMSGFQNDHSLEENEENNKYIDLLGKINKA